MVESIPCHIRLDKQTVKMQRFQGYQCTHIDLWEVVDFGEENWVDTMEEATLEREMTEDKLVVVSQVHSGMIVTWVDN
jgi:hypothetical protein